MHSQYAPIVKELTDINTKLNDDFGQSIEIHCRGGFFTEERTEVVLTNGYHDFQKTSLIVRNKNNSPKFFYKHAAPTSSSGMSDFKIVEQPIQQEQFWEFVSAHTETITRGLPNQLQSPSFAQSREKKCL